VFIPVSEFQVYYEENLVTILILLRILSGFLRTKELPQTLVCGSFLLSMKPDGIVRGIKDSFLKWIIASRWTIRRGMHVH